MIGNEDFLKVHDEMVQRWPKLKSQLNVYYNHLKDIPYDALQRICSDFIDGARHMPLPKDYREAYKYLKTNDVTHNDSKERDAQQPKRPSI